MSGEGEWCPICGQYVVFSMQNHKCPPKFVGWSPDFGQGPGSGHTVYARNYDHAAEQWAAWHDSNSAEYDIVGGCEVEVHIRRFDDEEGPVRRFRVVGRAEPNYVATPLPADPVNDEF